MELAHRPDRAVTFADTRAPRSGGFPEQPEAILDWERRLPEMFFRRRIPDTEAAIEALADGRPLCRPYQHVARDRRRHLRHEPGVPHLLRCRRLRPASPD